MHIPPEKIREELKKSTIQAVKDIIAQRDELAQQHNAAHQLWTALVNAPRWGIAMTEHYDPNWREPEEIWSQSAEVVTKGSGKE